LEKRGPHRPEHLSLAKEFHEKGQILMAGAHADAGGACFVFQCDDTQPIDDFVKRDPYVQNGLVPAHRVKEWTVVDLASV